MEPWHITLFGSVRVQRGNQDITRFKSQKVAGLLAYLAYYLRQAHPRDVLIDLFWPESEPEAGRASLSVALSSLRNQLEPPGTPASAVVRADRFSVSLNPATVITDVGEFEEVIQTASRSDSLTERIQNLTLAVERYQSRLLPGFYEEWILPEQERLAGLFDDAASTLLSLLEAQGDIPGALRVARQAVSVDTLREEAHERLIRLLVAAGQPGAALRQYRELERRLEEELGEEPSASLRALYRQIEKQTGLNAPPLFAPPVATVSPLKSEAAGLPSGVPTTVNLLLTEVETSPRLQERTGDAIQTGLETYHRLLRQECTQHGGQAIKETDDSCVALFPSPHSALACAVAIQQALSQKDEGGRRKGAEEATDSSFLPHPSSLSVRMALHTGEVQITDGAYQGQALTWASRLLTTGAGGQILVSEATAVLLRRNLTEQVRLVDLGVWRLRDVPAPERLFSVEYSGMPTRGFGPVAAEAGYQSRLPLQFTRFFGREEELVHLQELLTPSTSEVRLVTLTGPGGTGKSRLAVEAAGRLLEVFQGAVWFVHLADLADSRLISGAIQKTLNLPSSPQEPLEQITAALAKQPSLLVLDNFEHLVEGGAETVQYLLSAVPSLRVLISSRRLLGLSAEREFPVPPLSIPNGPETPEQLSLCDSVRLFVDRAQNALPFFQVTNNNAPAVAELCQRLEGIPLAIELAAARAVVMTPAQMLAQLQNRFDFLATRKRDVDERHRTLRAAIEWSYRLLTPELQRFCARLSVFRGGWTVDAAEAVCEEPLALDYLAQLRECSLILSEETEQGMRFRMLETLREFAEEHLATQEVAFLQARHIEYFQEFADKAARNLNGAEQAEWLNRLEAEYDNLRAALLHSTQESLYGEAGQQLCVALFRFWEIRGYFSEALSWCAEALKHSDTQEKTPVRARVLRRAGSMARALGDYKQASSWLEEGLAVFQELEDWSGVQATLHELGRAADIQGDYVAARSRFEEALVISRERGNRAGEAGCLNSLGVLAGKQNDLMAARVLFEESLEIRRELKDGGRIASSLSNLGNIALLQSDFVSARALLEESLGIQREIDDQLGIACALNNLGTVSCEQGDYAAARALFKESLEIEMDLLHKQGITDSFESLALLAVAEDRVTTSKVSSEHLEAGRAAMLWGAEERLREEIGAPLPPNEQEKHDQAIAEVRQALGETAFKAAWEAGRAFTWEEAVAYALEKKGD